MKIIKPSYAIEERSEERGGLTDIEKAARTCYRTEARIGEGSAEAMVRMLIRRGHDAMLEHGDYAFIIDDYHIFDNAAYSLRRLFEETGDAPRLAMTSGRGRHIISGNIRAWRELIASGSAAAYYFTGAIDPIYTEDLIPDAERVDEPRVRQIRYAELVGAVEQRAHLRQTVRFVIDRGISHEFVRHRVMSFAQESSRFCNYSDERFGGEITVIEPCYLAPDSGAYYLWQRQCMTAETAYFALLDVGMLPEEARGVLPQSVRTELVVTGTLGGWQHFFDLRALGKAGKPHPQAREVAEPLCFETARRYPGAIITG